MSERESRLADIRARLESISELYAPRGTARGFYVEQSIADINFLLAELDAASAAAADRMAESGCARLWLVSRKCSTSGSGAVVIAADTEGGAVATVGLMGYWLHGTALAAHPIGWAVPGLRGVVLADFKAG